MKKLSYRNVKNMWMKSGKIYGEIEDLAKVEKPQEEICCITKGILEISTTETNSL